MALRSTYVKSRRDEDGDDESGDTKAMPIGLADNGGTPFQCGTCEWFSAGHCHNKNPQLNGRKVEAQWCCNLYDRDEMKIVVR